ARGKTFQVCSANRARPGWCPRFRCDGFGRTAAHPAPNVSTGVRDEVNGEPHGAAELDRRHDATRRTARNPDADSDAAHLRPVDTSTGQSPLQAHPRRDLRATAPPG